MKGDRIDIIIGKMKPMRKPDGMQSSDFPQEVGDDSEQSEKEIMEEAAAEGLIQAVKSGDAKAVSEALKQWHEICYGPSPDGMMDDEEAEGEKGEY